MHASISVVQVPATIDPHFKQLGVRAQIEKNIFVPKNSLMLGLREDDEEFERYLRTNGDFQETKPIESSYMSKYNQIIEEEPENDNKDQLTNIFNTKQEKNENYKVTTPENIKDSYQLKIFNENQINNVSYKLVNSSSSSALPHFNHHEVQVAQDEEEYNIGAEFESSRDSLLKPSAHFNIEEEEKEVVTGGLAKLSTFARYKRPYSNINRNVVENDDFELVEAPIPLSKQYKINIEVLQIKDETGFGEIVDFQKGSPKNDNNTLDIYGYEKIPKVSSIL